MKSLIRVAVPLALVLFILAIPFAAVPADAPAKHYVCSPCGLPCDDIVYDQPGTCPKCGMPLVDQEVAKAAAHPRKKVAMLIFDGVEIIDYTGPWEVFGAAGFDVYSVAETKKPVTSAMGMTVVPKFSFGDAPQPDVLVVPGGGVKAARDSAATLAWVRDVTARAERTMSVCNGAFILASAGLLDGLTATTTYGRIDSLKADYPKVTVVHDRRFVDNGRIITAAGLSSGIDGALHVVSRMLGEGTAQEVALALEYDWRPRDGFVRAALADRNIPNVDLDALGKWNIVRTEGGTDHWEIVLDVISEKSAADVMDHFGRAFATRGKWTSVKVVAASSSSPTRTDWKFSDRDGGNWTGTLTVTPRGKGGPYTAKLAIARAG